jgi:hypothetical protein
MKRFLEHHLPAIEECPGLNSVDVLWPARNRETVILMQARLLPWAVYRVPIDGRDAFVAFTPMIS